ncbi:MAG: AmmeMemoRadiSam system protein B [Candidatus Eisenbacteria bacterium]|uniref:AmmeMemoRadiSam system protein B n=1 Tax=Eiseniibacteriota bacterium TaxID=2212470 RepID=A0A9D6L8T0_UNCEI|nr:AmmeMemoRadiSam system protein B [Candidatus Eisenbacteria bacterium]MBI3539760.1 AmmeMemoRadiSam system protein B [Candidatus Eisenbacteria bacterium]
MSSSSDTPRRIILPGEERAAPPPPEPANAGAGDGPESGPSPASRIVLPPGVAAESYDDLPEYPRLRPLEIMVAREGDRDLLLVHDPLGIMPAPIALRPEALELMRVLDGTLSLRDIAAEVVRASKDLRAGATVKEFVAQLDRLLMLDSPRFEAAYRDVRERYHALEIRQTVLAGHSYPEDRDALRRVLDGHFAEAERMRAEAGEPVAAADARPRALLAPHLDPRRAGAVIARAFLELGVEQPAPLRVVVWGTGHTLFGDPLALTRKHFETPFGPMRCDTAFVDALAARLGDMAWHGELAHRDEHSIEFAALYLQYRFGDRPVTIVPILCGGFHALLDQGKGPRDEAAMETLIATARDAERTLGGATVHVAAVDLSHVGPRFGDPPVDERTLHETETRDRAALEAARRGDADGWNAAIAADGDATRVCGWGATWAMLRAAAPGDGRLLRYEQSKEPNGSMVSVAALVWP